MEIKELNIKDVFEITLTPIADTRGFFMRTFDDKIFNAAGLNFNWVQENHSRTLRKGTIRGLHFQLPPYSETKLIRCLRGKILDVFVDLRKNSPTFGQWDSVELTEDKFNMILIPRSFAHGFKTLTDNCEVVYKVDNYYSKENECGIIWNDSELNINWNTGVPILSDKDKSNMSFKDFVNKYKYIAV